MNIYELISRAQGLRQETKLDSVSPDRVGALCEDTLKYINEFQLLASSPSLHKIYASVSAMQADAAPKSDLTGKALKPGQLVVIVPASQSDATAGDVYRYDGPSGNTSAWTFISKIGGLPADAELNATSTNPVQNAAVTAGFTELWENLDHGTFPNLVAGDLAGRGESVPAEFGFRASGGKSIKDGRAYIKRIKGNSVVWNQILNNLGEGLADKTETNTEVRIIPTDVNGNRFGNGVNVIEGHYYLQMVDILSEEGTPVGFQNYLNLDCGNKTTSTSYVQLWQIARASASGTSYVQLWSKEGTPYRIKKDSFNLIDLTKMFGAGNEPTTIEEFNARVATLGIDMYAYNEGQVIHCNTESIKSVGDNALNTDRSIVSDFDGSYGNYGFINTEDAFVGISADGYINDGVIDYAEKIEGGFRLRNNAGGYGIGLFVKALPNEEYSVSYASDNGRIAFGFYDKGKNLISYESRETRFTTPSNCEYIMLCLRDNEVTNIDISFTDIMLTLVHSGWKQDTDAGYQPYWQDTLQLPIIRKYFPDGMKKAGSAHDEIRFNKAIGKWEAVQRIGGSVDMGTSDWYLDGDTFFTIDERYFAGMRLISSLYTNIIAKDENMNMYAVNGILRAFNSAYTDAASFKAAMQGVILYYELAEPIVTELDAEDQNFRDYYNVADFGTEQSQSSVPSAPFSADIIYQFNAVDQIRENANDIKTLETKIAELQSQIATLLAGG